MVLTTVGVVSVREVLQSAAPARVERTRAVEARAAPEELVEFTLGDLRARLESLDRVDALEGVGERVDEYYAVTPPTLDSNRHESQYRLQVAETLALVAVVDARTARLQDRDDEVARAEPILHDERDAPEQRWMEEIRKMLDEARTLSR